MFGRHDVDWSLAELVAQFERRACFDEQTNGFFVAARGGDVQRRRLVRVERVDGCILQQQRDAPGGVLGGGPVQRRATFVVERRVLSAELQHVE